MTTASAPLAPLPNPHRPRRPHPRPLAPSRCRLPWARCPPIHCPWPVPDSIPRDSPPPSARSPRGSEGSPQSRRRWSEPRVGVRAGRWGSGGRDRRRLGRPPLVYPRASCSGLPSLQVARQCVSAAATRPCWKGGSTPGDKWRGLWQAAAHSLSLCAAVEPQPGSNAALHAEDRYHEFVTWRSQKDPLLPRPLVLRPSFGRAVAS